MIKTITDFLGNPLYSFLLATVVGIISNLLTGKFLDRTKRLWWGVNSDWLRYFYFDETNKLKITYKGLDNRQKEVNRSLSALRFVLWSNGKDTLHNSDISSKEPLVITLEPDTEILEIRPIASSNPTIQIKPLNKNAILVNFEYLKTDQGIIFDVIVLGLATKASLNGVLKDGKVLTKELRPINFMISYSFLPRKWNQRKKITVLKWVFTSFFIFSLWTSLVIIFSLIEKTFSVDGVLLAIQMVFTALSYVFFSYPFWTTPVIPQELTQFYDDIV
jgi:hypothetical protein